MRVAAIDCGTNSIRLLIADIDGNNFREIVRDMEIVRLGQGVDQTGQFHSDAIARTLAAVDKFAAEIAKRGVEKIRFCATSECRHFTRVGMPPAETSSTSGTSMPSAERDAM